MSATAPIARARPLEPAEARRLRVDGRSPSWHVKPSTPEAAAAALREATAAGLAVGPRGAGASLGLGAPPARLDVALETTELSGLVLYRPEDLTAVALAGTPLAVLQAAFAREGQWLALDPPHAERATLGGVLAIDDSGPHRLRYGTARNLVLGMQVAQSDGRLVRSGARVVKNVAGYNLHKLHIGALGTLGVIVEVALRLHPLPRDRAAVVCAVPAPEAAGAIVARLARLPLRLGALELLNAPAARRALDAAGLAGVDARDGSPFTLIALCEGYAQVVRRQIQEVTTAVEEHGGIVVAIVDDSATARRLGTALAAAPEGAPDSDLVLAAGVPPAQTCAVAGKLAALTGAGAHIIAHAGSGAIRAVVPVTPAAAAALVARARGLARECGGHVVVWSCPPEAKQDLDIWGPVAAPKLMRALKAALDPAGTLNPGRFVEGL